VITIHQRYRRTDRQTTCDRNTVLCTKVHRAVKIVIRLLHAAYRRNVDCCETQKWKICAVKLSKSIIIHPCLFIACILAAEIDFEIGHFRNFAPPWPWPWRWIGSHGIPQCPLIDLYLTLPRKTKFRSNHSNRKKNFLWTYERTDSPAARRSRRPKNMKWKL